MALTVEEWWELAGWLLVTLGTSEVPEGWEDYEVVPKMTLRGKYIPPSP